MHHLGSRTSSRRAAAKAEARGRRRFRQRPSRRSRGDGEGNHRSACPSAPPPVHAEHSCAAYALPILLVPALPPSPLLAQWTARAPLYREHPTAERGSREIGRRTEQPRRAVTALESGKEEGKGGETDRDTGHRVLLFGRWWCGRTKEPSTPTQRKGFAAESMPPGLGKARGETGRNRQLLLEDPSGDEDDRQLSPPPTEAIRVLLPRRLTPPSFSSLAWAPARNGRRCAGSSALVSVGDSARGGASKEDGRRSAPDNTVARTHSPHSPTCGRLPRNAAQAGQPRGRGHCHVASSATPAPKKTGRGVRLAPVAFPPTERLVCMQGQRGRQTGWCVTGRTGLCKGAGCRASGRRAEKRTPTRTRRALLKSLVAVSKYGAGNVKHSLLASQASGTRHHSKFRFVVHCVLMGQAGLL